LEGLRGLRGVGDFYLRSDFFEKENLLNNPRLFLARAFFVEMG